MTGARPLPPGNPVSAPYWEGARRRELRVQRCGRCDRLVFQPRLACPRCGGRALRWEPVSGRAQVYTFTVLRRAPHPAFVGNLPLVVAIVELEEGPRLTTNIVGCEPDDVRVGMEVEVDFADAGDGVTLPVFRPAGRT